MLSGAKYIFCHTHTHARTHARTHTHTQNPIFQNQLYHFLPLPLFERTTNPFSGQAQQSGKGTYS